MRADLLRFRRGRPLAAAPVTAIVAELPTATVANTGIERVRRARDGRQPPRRAVDDTGTYAREPRRRRHPALFTVLTLLVLAAFSA